MPQCVPMVLGSRFYILLQGRRGSLGTARQWTTAEHETWSSINRLSLARASATDSSLYLGPLTQYTWWRTSLESTSHTYIEPPNNVYIPMVAYSLYYNVAYILWRRRLLTYRVDTTHTWNTLSILMGSLHCKDQILLPVAMREHTLLHTIILWN